MVINSLESGIRYPPFLIVFGLGDVSHMHRHNDIHLLLVFLDPFGLLEKAGALITDDWPVFLRLFVPGICVTLSVRQNDEGERTRIAQGLLIQRSLPSFDVISLNISPVSPFHLEPIAGFPKSWCCNPFFFACVQLARGDDPGLVFNQGGD
jgi:hypothetical protein